MEGLGRKALVRDEGVEWGAGSARYHRPRGSDFVPVITLGFISLGRDRGIQERRELVTLTSRRRCLPPLDHYHATSRPKSPFTCATASASSARNSWYASQSNRPSPTPSGSSDSVSRCKRTVSGQTGDLVKHGEIGPADLGEAEADQVSAPAAEFG